MLYFIFFAHLSFYDFDFMIMVQLNGSLFVYSFHLGGRF